MIRGPRRFVAAALLLCTAFLFSALTPRLRAQADDNNSTIDKPEYGVPHLECSFFGPQRDRFLRGDQELRQLDVGRSSSALTEQVVNAIGAGRPAPGRSRSGDLRDTTYNNYIDTGIFTALHQLGIPPADLATDQEFLRRVTLDLTGRIPTAQEVTQFLGDPRPNKRQLWIEQLLATPQWADRWAMFFGDLYKNTLSTPQVNRFQPGRDAFHYYILDSLRANKSYKDMASEVITGSGSTFEAGQANFTLGGRTTGGPVQDTYDTQAVMVSTVFLGMGHMDCILCHDGRGHLGSLTLWGSQAKRVDAWSMAAFFARTDMAQASGTENVRPWIITDSTSPSRNYQLNTRSGNRPTRAPVSGKNFAAPAFVLSGAKPKDGDNWRNSLATMVVSDFQFARATVNYIWREFMTLPLVDPPDQFDPLRLDPNNPPPGPWTLQPTNPALLNALAQNFIHNNYNLKALMRDITNSRAYQLSARYDGTWDPLWEKYYARHLVRRLTAEEAHDATALSSGVPGGYVLAGFREPVVNFAMQLPDVVGVPGGTGGQFLDSFLRGNRDDVARRGDLTTQQPLTLMNSQFVYSRTRNVAGTLVNKVVKLPNDQIIDQLFLNVLSRYPTPDERSKATGRLNLAANPHANNVEDLAWSLYNKVDFIFNY